MHIHYAEKNLPKGKFIELLLSSNVNPHWNLTLNKNEFFINKYDWNNYAIPIIALLKQLPSQERVYDAANKIWIIPEAKWLALQKVLDAFLITRIKQNKSLYDWIKENPNTPSQKEIPHVDDFFYKQPESQSYAFASKTLTKAEVEGKLRGMLGINSEVPFCTLTSDNLKKLYRKAALKFHPDVNNGDGSKMTELNFYWQELQKL